jgi:N-acyl homoserine lactone hydrolase
MKILPSLLLLLSNLAYAGPRLYVFDCGVLYLDSIAMFNVTAEESPVKEMFVPCYLVEHQNGRLFWDAGLPKKTADATGRVPLEIGSMAYDRWILDQLADMKLQPADIDYAAFSHLHYDHAGAANSFVDSTILMQKTEWDGAVNAGPGAIDTSLFDDLKQANIKFLAGDHDVFGDGSVQLIYAPGHTAGHQVLLLELENTGTLMLSGDLYHTRANRRLRRAPTFNVDAEQTHRSMDKIEALLTETGATLWIEHDKALADSLKKAPHYYD